MNRPKIALYLTSTGWASGVILCGIGLFGGPEVMSTALFFGPALGFLLHGAAALIAVVALIRPHPGSPPRRPAVIALAIALVGLAAAFGVSVLWVAVASHGGA